MWPAAASGTTEQPRIEVGEFSLSVVQNPEKCAVSADRTAPDRVVRAQAHPEIVSVQTITQAPLPRDQVRCDAELVRMTNKVDHGVVLAGCGTEHELVGGGMSGDRLPYCRSRG